jgi:hypothetical protein
MPLTASLHLGGKHFFIQPFELNPSQPGVASQIFAIKVMLHCFGPYNPHGPPTLPGSCVIVWQTGYPQSALADTLYPVGGIGMALAKMAFAQKSNSIPWIISKARCLCLHVVIFPKPLDRGTLLETVNAKFSSRMKDECRILAKRKVGRGLLFFDCCTVDGNQIQICVRKGELLSGEQTERISTFCTGDVILAECRTSGDNVGDQVTIDLQEARVAEIWRNIHPRNYSIDRRNGRMGHFNISRPLLAIEVKSTFAERLVHKLTDNSETIRKQAFTACDGDGTSVKLSQVMLPEQPRMAGLLPRQKYQLVIVPSDASTMAYIVEDCLRTDEVTMQNVKSWHVLHTSSLRLSFGMQLLAREIKNRVCCNSTDGSHASDGGRSSRKSVTAQPHHTHVLPVVSRRCTCRLKAFPEYLG